MNILLVNDDGIDAPGILKLAEVLSRQHSIYIVAPKAQRSCYSHSVTYYRQINAAEHRVIPNVMDAWAIDATPADCAYYGCNGLLDRKPDLLISGINDGPNMASDTIYSGTVGAASEGVIQGVPSIAISLAKNHCTHYETAARVAQVAVARFMKAPECHGNVLNINVPDLAWEDLRGVKTASVGGVLNYRKTLVKIPKGNGCYDLQIGNDPIVMNTGEDMRGTDLEAVAGGYVSVTLLHHDLCAKEKLPLLKAFEDMLTDH